MTDVLCNGCIPFELQEIGLLKFEILASGLCVSEQARRLLEDSKRPIRTRSGASGGLDIVLPYDVHVNAPVLESFSRESSLALDVRNDDLVVCRSSEVLCSAELQPVPAYYSRATVSGAPMVQVGQMCSGDRFCYGMTGPYCIFWKAGQRCLFCSIGLNRKDDAPDKDIDSLLETLEAAVEDPRIPARHVLIGGGTPNTRDMGAVLAARLCRAIKKRFSLSCYVMICAPSENNYIDMLWDSGADELGMNLEFWSASAWQRFIPGKHHWIGKDRYLGALDHAVRRFGPVNTRSLLVAGLESAAATIEGATYLASMGVMPILSPFRPLAGTTLEDTRGFSHEEYWNIYVSVLGSAGEFNVPVGPTCIPCQNNTLALPLPGDSYRFY